MWLRLCFLSHGSVINDGFFGQGFESKIIMGFRNGFDIMIVNCSHYCSATHMSVELGSEKTLCEESLFRCSSSVVYSGQYEAFHIFCSSFCICYADIHWRTDITSYMETYFCLNKWHSKTFKLHKYKMMSVSKLGRHFGYVWVIKMLLFKWFYVIFA